MGKLTKSAIILLTILCISCGGEEKKPAKVYYDFRNARWGMSIGEVRDTETGIYIGKIAPKGNGGGLLSVCDTLLEYEGKAFDGLDCSILYGFIGGELVNAQYKISTPYSILVYYELKEVLAMTFTSIEREKYGFKKEGEESIRVNRARYENKNTDLTLTAIYPENRKTEQGNMAGKSLVNIGYESKSHRALLKSKKKLHP